MKKNTYIAELERLLIKLYDNHELTSNLLTCIMKEMSDCYINPDQTSGLETYDSKTFKQLICFVLQPQTYQEIMEESPLIDDDGGRIWTNLKKAESQFEYLWFDVLKMSDSEEEAENRPIVPLVVPID